MAVFTSLENADVESFLESYALGTLISFEGIKDGVENSNFHLFTTTGRSILTLIERRVAESELPFFSAFMNHLRSKGVPCPDVSIRTDGSFYGHIRGKPALITKFLPGVSHNNVTLTDCEQFGRQMAAMHIAAVDFKPARENKMGYPEWERLICEVGAKADALQPGLSALLEDELAFLKQNLPAMSLPTGVIHADLFPDNVFFRNGMISGVFDFYFSCTDFFAYDLMLGVNAWCFDKKDGFRRGHADALLDGYKALRPLSPAEKSALPLLGRAAAVRIIATRLFAKINHDPAALVAPHDPLEHVRILKFHQDHGIA